MCDASTVCTESRWPDCIFDEELHGMDVSSPFCQGQPNDKHLFDYIHEFYAKTDDD